MAIQHMDNWAIYGGNTNNLTNGVYAQVFIENGGNQTQLVSDPDGTSTGTVLKMLAGAFNPAGVRYVVNSGHVMGTAQRLYLSKIPASNGEAPRVFSFLDFGNNVIIEAWYNTIGGIDVYDGSQNLLGRTSGPVVTANAWWHIESKVDTVNGTCEIRVEGVTVLALTGLSLGSATIYQVRQFSAGDNDTPFLYCKDFVIWDGSGTLNNDFLGSVVVYSLLPNADTTLGGWTLTGGTTGYGILDTAPPQDDVKYIGAAFPLPAAAQFAVSDLPANVTAVKAIMPMVRAKKVDGGDGNLQQSLVSGSATGNGNNRPITAAYTYFRDVFETDPNTTAAWTVAATNAVQIKLNRTV